MQSNEWIDQMMRQIGEGIDRARSGRSDQWISDRTQRIGSKLSRTAISEYRRGVRKSMPVTDLLVLAAALEVPPVALLFPDLPNGLVELLPDHTNVTAFDAAQWVSGERQTVPEGGSIFFDEENQRWWTTTNSEYKTGYRQPDPTIFDRTEDNPANATKILELSRNLASVVTALRNRLDLIWEEAISGSPSQIEDAERLIDSTNERIERIEEFIYELGGNVENPAFPAEGPATDAEG